jgi:hypothetical protein
VIRVRLVEDYFGWIARIDRADGGFVEVYSSDGADALRLALEAHREGRRARHAARRKLN